MSGFKGDFMGFTYNGVHSSELGIVRVSNGSRFDENLLPTMQDKTVQVPGGDGTYYFGSYYTQRKFSVSFAFDGLTEFQLEQLRAHFGDKKIHDLVFDEAPYKTYQAKVTGSTSIKHIPFAEGETNRIYKGEGTIEFTCYQPFAVCKKKYLEQYDEENYPNKEEWAAASKMQQSKDGFDALNGGNMYLYNPGVADSDFRLKIPFKDGKIQEATIIIKNASGVQCGWLAWREMSRVNPDVYVKIDSKTNLIEGYDSNNKKTGNIYNEYIVAGDFFKIPVNTIGGYRATLQTNLQYTANEVIIEYNYYYY